MWKQAFVPISALVPLSIRLMGGCRLPYGEHSLLSVPRALIMATVHGLSPCKHKYNNIPATLP